MKFNTILFTLALLAVCASAGPCPDITAYRSPYVQTSFNPAMAEGYWYEQEYIDIAQIGSSCQTLNVTSNATDGSMSMAFAVLYAGIPFTIIEAYTPLDTKAYYMKQAQMPGSALLKLP